MSRTIFYYLVFSLLLFFTSVSEAQEITGPFVKVRENSVIVSATVDLDEKHLSEIEKGVSKEIIVYFDLFREWKIWPDEFIIGKKFTQTLQCDPVKKEYIATSLVGTRLTEKRFSNCKRLIQWALSFSDLTLTNINEIEPAEYMVRVTVESRLRRLPPFIDLLFFFVKEREFKISHDSPYFPLKLENEIQE